MQKKDNNLFLYVKYILFIVIIVLLFIFRNYFVTIFLGVKNKFFSSQVETSLTVSEREELNTLRVENKVLKDENTKVREEFSIGIIDESPSSIYLLLEQSSLYGDFYVTLPKNKTIYKGMNIFSSGNVVVGQVVEILPNALKIERLGQNKSFIATSMEGEEFIEFRSLSSGLYAGTVGGGSNVSLGDTIVLKGYPKAIVGTVVEIAKGDNSLSIVYVRTPYNIQKKQMFYVLQ